MAATPFQYKDLSLAFLKHPTTRDLVVLIDEDAVKRSIKHLVMTAPYERPFQSQIGTRINSLLFEPQDLITERLLVREIQRVITQFESRVQLLSVLVQTPTDHAYEVTIEFKLLNRNEPVQLILTLVRNR